MSGRALDKRCASCGMPCHKYIVRNLGSEKEMLEFERAYIDLMLFHDYTESEIETALASFTTQIPGNSPISGKGFTIRGGGPDFGSFVTSVAYDNTIQTYPKCSALYKKYDSRLHACALCEFSNKYAGHLKPLELKLIRYMLESEERYQELILNGLQPELFKVPVDVMEYASSKRAYPFLLYRQIVQFMEKEDVRKEQYGKPTICTKIRTLLRERLKRMRLPEAFQNKEWLDRLISVWEFEIYKTPLIDEKQSEELLLQLKGVPATEPKRKESSAKEKSDVFDLFGFAGMTISEQTPVTADFVKNASEDIRKRTSKNKPEEISHVDVEKKADAKSTKPSGADSEKRKTTAAVPPDKEKKRSEEKKYSEVVAQKADASKTEEHPVMDDKRASISPVTKTDDKKELPVLIAKERSGERRSETDSNRTSECKNVDDTDAGASGYYRIVDDIEVLTADEVIDAGSEEIHAYDIDLGLMEDVSDMPGQLEMNGDFIYRGYIAPQALESIICLDRRNSRILSAFETSVVKHGFLAFEVCERIDTHQRVILFWEPASQSYFYTELKDSMCLETIGAIFSASSVRKISYSPYPIYSMMKAFRVSVKNLECLQTRHYSCGQGEADYISVLNSYHLPLYPENIIQSDCAGYELFAYMPNYHTVWRIQERRIASSERLTERYHSFRLLSEAIGYSYDSPYLILSDNTAPLVKMPNPMQFVFQKCSERVTTPGYLLMYQPARKDASYANMIRDLLCELSDRGRFRNCDIQVAAITTAGLFLYVSEEDFEYLFTFISKLLLILKRKGDYKNVVINTAYKHLQAEIPSGQRAPLENTERKAEPEEKDKVATADNKDTVTDNKNAEKSAHAETSDEKVTAPKAVTGTKDTAAGNKINRSGDKCNEPTGGKKSVEPKQATAARTAKDTLAGSAHKDIVIRDKKYPPGVCLIKIRLLSPDWGNTPLLDSEGSEYTAEEGQLPF